jgi:hypothetical protein
LQQKNDISDGLVEAEEEVSKDPIASTKKYDRIVNTLLYGPTKGSR